MAETCELVLALDACGLRERAAALFTAIGRQRHADGSYWTGWQFADQAHFPDERSTWTSAAVLLAADALTGFSRGAAIFRGWPGRPWPAADAAGPAASLRPGRRCCTR